MKKLFVLAAIAGGVLFAVKRNKDNKAEAELWREATAPTVNAPTTSANGSSPAHTSASRNN